MIQIEKNIFNIFPIFIFVEDNFLSEEQCDFISKFLNDEETYNHSLISGDGTSSHRLSPTRVNKLVKNGILDKMPAPLSELKQKIQERVDYYSQVALLKPNEIELSWFNVQNEGSQLLPHAHEGSVATGALYINTDELSSNLDLFNPNYAVNSSGSLDNDRFFTSYRVKRGSLLIFPSYLVHGNIKENRTHNRIVISFNTIRKINI